MFVVAYTVPTWEVSGVLFSTYKIFLDCGVCYLYYRRHFKCWYFTRSACFCLPVWFQFCTAKLSNARPPAPAIYTCVVSKRGMQIKWISKGKRGVTKLVTHRSWVDRVEKRETLTNFIYAPAIRANLKRSAYVIRCYICIYTIYMIEPCISACS